MATKPLLHVDGEYGVWARYKWEGLANGDDGAPLQLDRLAADITVQAVGTNFGTPAAGTLKIAAANDDVPSYAFLADPTGTEIALTAAGITALRDQPRLIRPELAGGTAGTGDIDVWCMVRFVSG